jgi:hypothetical protein
VRGEEKRETTSPWKVGTFGKGRAWLGKVGKWRMHGSRITKDRSALSIAHTLVAPAANNLHVVPQRRCYTLSRHSGLRPKISRRNMLCKLNKGDLCLIIVIVRTT